MNAGALGRGAFAALAALLLAGNVVTGVSAATLPGAVPVSFSVPPNIGTVQNLGNQTYAVSGGHVVTASIGGKSLDPGATLVFSLAARVTAQKVTGVASFDLRGSVLGVPVSATGPVAIVGAVSSSQGSLATGQACSSAPCGQLPVFFVGASSIKIGVAGAQTLDVTGFTVENPYFNPFGAPIILSSTDGAVVIVANYDVGRILWQGTAVGGPITGLLGSSILIAGTLGLTSTEAEDLVAGTAVDTGTISLSSMSPALLDVSGTYVGSSFIPPPTPGSDCSTLFGFPAGSGVCTMTGFDSSGKYVMTGPSAKLVGTYSTVWTIPALAFSSTSTAVLLP